MIVCWKGQIYVPDKKEGNYPDSKVCAEFIATSTDNKEFIALLSVVKKPLLGVVVDERNFSGDVQSLLQNISETSGTGHGKTVLIPTSISKSDKFPVRIRRGRKRDTVNKTDVLLFSSASPIGFIDSSLLNNPLGLIGVGKATVNMDKVSSSSDIAKAIWKLRNTIKVLSYNQFIRTVNTSQINKEQEVNDGGERK
jgi:hypothetical protein